MHPKLVRSKATYNMNGGSALPVQGSLGYYGTIPQALRKRSTSGGMDTDSEVVAIEEWSPKNDLTASALKKWADRYPFPGEIKGGCLQGLRPKKIIVLSNYTPEQCFLNQEDLGPILRRFTVIKFPVEVKERGSALPISASQSIHC